MDFSLPYWNVIETEEELEILKTEALKFTYEELAKRHNTSRSKMYVICQFKGIKAKRPKRLKEARHKKVSEEDRELKRWASSFNAGRLRYVYYDMLKRCYNKEDHAYYRYGGRGITVCEEWKNNHLTFFKWAKENGYDKGLQLDRKDNGKGYSPANCRWVTARENVKNRNCTRWISFNGERHTLKEWAELTKIPYQVLSDRIYRYGWTIEKALTTTVL